MSTTSKHLLDSILDGDREKTKENFNELMKQKASDVVAAKEITIAKTINKSEK